MLGTDVILLCGAIVMKHNAGGKGRVPNEFHTLDRSCRLESLVVITRRATGARSRSTSARLEHPQTAPACETDRRGLVISNASLQNTRAELL
jgi:hypothetical protein